MSWIFHTVLGITLLCLIGKPTQTSGQLIGSLLGWQVSGRLLTGLETSGKDDLKNDRDPDQTNDLRKRRIAYGGQVRLLTPWSFGVSIGYTQSPLSSLEISYDNETGTGTVTNLLEQRQRRLPISAFYRSSLDRVTIEVEVGMDVGRAHLTNDSEETGPSAYVAHLDMAGSGNGFHFGGNLAVGIGKGFEMFVHTEYLSLKANDYTGISQGDPVEAIVSGKGIHILSRGTPLPSVFGAGQPYEHDISGLRVMFGITANLPLSKMGAW